MKPNLRLSRGSQSMHASLQPRLNVRSFLNEVQIDLANRLLQADDEWAARNSKADFAYMAAIWAPSCDEEALRLIIDWNTWVRSIVTSSCDQAKSANVG